MIRFFGLIVVMLLTPVAQVMAGSATLNAPTAISIRGFSARDGSALCAVVESEVAQWSLDSQRNSQCTDRDWLSDNAAMVAADYGTIVQLDGKGDVYTVTIKNVRRADLNEPGIVSWNVKNVPDARVMLRKILRKYATFDMRKDEYKQNLVSNALARPIDDADFAAAYSQFARDPENARYVAAGLEIAAALGISVYSYYSVPPSENLNARDWDFATPADSFHEKISGRGVRFDDNHYITNNGHPFAGTGYYIFDRFSGASRLHALLFTLAGSSFWEYIGEFREVVSINDQINTTFGGFILGETVFQISKILRKDTSGSIFHRVANTVFSAPARLSAIIEDHVTSGARRFTDLDLTPDEQDFWSYLNIYLSANSIDGRLAHVFGMNAEVINIPQFESPGKVSATWLNEDTVDTQLEAERGAGSGITRYMRVLAKITLAAIYKKNMSLDDKDRLEGYQLFIGPASAFEINDTTIGSDARKNNSDFMTDVHVLGGTADITAYRHGTKIRFWVDLYGDFAMIHSPAFDAATNGEYIDIAYTKSNCGSIQSVLCHEGYYYGWGPTARGGVTVTRGRLQAGASVESSDEYMINARSRFLETAKDIDANDIWTAVKGWVAVSLPHDVALEFGVEKTIHRSEISGPQFSAADAKLSQVMKYGRVVWKFD